MKPFIFCLDGIDGVGKTTAAVLVYQIMQERYGQRARKMNIGETPLGAHLRGLVKDPKYTVSPICERMLFAADLASSLELVLKPAIAENKIVIADRWTSFTDFPYGMARGLTGEWIGTLFDLFTIPKLDGLFILDDEFDTIMERKKQMMSIERNQCRIERGGADFMRQVHGYYREALVSAHHGADVPTEQGGPLPMRRVAEFRANHIEGITVTNLRPRDTAELIVEKIVSIIQREDK